MARVIDTAALYGVNYDVQVGDLLFPNSGATVTEAAVASRSIRSAASGAVLTGVRVGSRAIAVLALTPLRGSVWPTIVEGRPPAAPDEVVLGVHTLKRLGLRLGRPATLVSRNEVSMTVVGAAVFPPIGGGSGLGEGAAMTLAGARALDPDAHANFGLVAFATTHDGKRPSSALAGAEQLPPLPPGDVLALRDVRAVPIGIALLFAATAAAAVGAALHGAVRRRRGEYACLAALGFSRRQVANSVRTQAGVLALSATVLGTPVGVLIGRTVWSQLADQLGVVNRPVVSLGQVGLVLAGTWVAAGVLAALPARQASRIRPAATLRVRL